MAVYKVHKNNNYSVMSNIHFRDTNLSWKAKGILSTMFSLPVDWDYSVKGLETLSSDMETSLRTGLKELEKFGYLKRLPLREKGKIIDWEYNIFENPHAENPVVENPRVVNPVVENQAQLNTKQLNTKEEKTKELNTNTYTVFEHWNSLNIIKHKELTEHIEKFISKALKSYSLDVIIGCMDNYNTIIKDSSYYFDHKWSLVDFLTRKNGLPNFTDEGSTWNSYHNRTTKSNSNSKQPNANIMDSYMRLKEQFKNE